MVISGMMELATALDAGLAPADMVNPQFMETLYASEKIVFGNTAEGLVHMLMSSAFVGTKTCLGLDNPGANSEKLKAIRDHLAAWTRQARAESEAVPYVETRAAVVYRALDKALRDAAALETKLAKTCSITTVCLMLAPPKALERNAFGKEGVVKATQVDWAAMAQQRRLGEFLASLVSALYHKVSATNMDHLLKAFFGERYAGTPTTLRTVKGGYGGYYGAFVFFPVYGNAMSATRVLLKLLGSVAMLDNVSSGEQQVLGFPHVLTVGKPTALLQDQHQYTIDLGDNVVTDAQVYKAVKAAYKAAEQAAVDGDTWKQAAVVQVCLELEAASGQESKVHIVTRGEIGLRARTGVTFDGKAFPMYEVLLDATAMTAHCYVLDLGTDQQTREGLRNVLCKYAGVSTTTTVAGDHKARNKTVVENGVVLFTDSHFEAGLAQVLESVEGVDKRLGGVVKLANDDANYLRMIDEEVQVVVAYSPTALRHLLDKLAWPYSLLRSPGGGGGAATSEIAALRQQLAQVALQASEQHAESAANFTALAAAREEEARAAREHAERLKEAVNAGQQQVQGLEANLRRVYGELKCSQESAALANQLNAEKQQAQGEAMLREMREVRQQSVQATALVHAIFKAAPDLALAVRDKVAALSNRAGDGEEVEPEEEGEVVDVDMLADQLLPRADEDGVEEFSDAQALAAVTAEELAAANARLEEAKRSNSNLDAAGGA